MDGPSYLREGISLRTYFILLAKLSLKKRGTTFGEGKKKQRTSNERSSYYSQSKVKKSQRLTATQDNCLLGFFHFITFMLPYFFAKKPCQNHGYKSEDRVILLER